MTLTQRIDKLERTYPGGETVVLFVIRNVGRLSDTARIADQVVRKYPDETEDALIDRALAVYRKNNPRSRAVSALVVDCRNQDGATAHGIL